VISLESRTLHQSAKLKNVPKNEYRFTLFKFFVNQNYAFLSIAKSIECSSFTARCRISVQPIRTNLQIPRGFRFFPMFTKFKIDFLGARTRFFPCGNVVTKQK